MFLIDEHRKNKTYDSDVINQFADLIEKKKYYNLLRKIESTEQLREIIRDEMLKNKDVTCKNVTTSKLFFFLIGMMKKYYLIVIIRNILKMNMEKKALNLY